MGLFVFSHALIFENHSLQTLTDAQGMQGLWERAVPTRGTNSMGNQCLLHLPSQLSSDKLLFKCYEGTWQDMEKLHVTLTSLKRNTWGKWGALNNGAIERNTKL